MDIDDEAFVRAVVVLQELARSGSNMETLLRSAKANVAVHASVMHALMAFYRAFDVPLSVATSLGTWNEFSGDNPGVSATKLELEYGDLIRSRIRPS